MPRAGLSPERVVDEAARIANREGLDRLTLAAVADSLGVRVPSLYKHVDGLPALRRAMALRAKHDLVAVLTRATVGRARRDALEALASAYADWARTHPAEYLAAQAPPVPGDETDRRVSAEVTGVVYDVLAGYGAGEVEMVDATRALRAGMHGFVALDAVGGFALPRPLAASMEWFLDALDARLSA
ncbi:MAG: TetR/AcrR family transcriptional regulator [Nocardioidaceae bacterium]